MEIKRNSSKSDSRSDKLVEAVSTLNDIKSGLKEVKQVSEDTTRSITANQRKATKAINAMYESVLDNEEQMMKLMNSKVIQNRIKTLTSTLDQLLEKRQQILKGGSREFTKTDIKDMVSSYKELQEYEAYMDSDITSKYKEMYTIQEQANNKSKKVLGEPLDTFVAGNKRYIKNYEENIKEALRAEQKASEQSAEIVQQNIAEVVDAVKNESNVQMNAADSFIEAEQKKQEAVKETAQVVQESTQKTKDELKSQIDYLKQLQKHSSFMNDAEDKRISMEEKGYDAGGNNPKSEADSQAKIKKYEDHIAQMEVANQVIEEFESKYESVVVTMKDGTQQIISYTYELEDAILNKNKIKDIQFNLFPPEEEIDIAKKSFSELDSWLESLNSKFLDKNSSEKDLNWILSEVSELRQELKLFDGDASQLESDLNDLEKGVMAVLAKTDIAPMTETQAELREEIEKTVEELYEESDAVFKTAGNFKQFKEQYKQLKMINNDISVRENPDNYIDTGMGKTFNGLDKIKTGSSLEELRAYKKEILELNPALNAVADSIKRINNDELEKVWNDFNAGQTTNALSSVSETQEEVKITAEQVTVAQEEMATETKSAQDKIQEEVEETIDSYDKLKAKLQELYAIGNSMQRHTIVEPGTYWGDNFGLINNTTKEDVIADMKEKWSEILAEEKSYSLNKISAKNGFSGSDKFRRLGGEYLSLAAIYEKVGGSLEDLNQKQQKAIKSGIEAQRVLENQSLAYWEEYKVLSEVNREKHFAYEDLVNQIDPNNKTLQIGGGLLDESMFTEADKSIRDFDSIVIDACQRLGIQLPESIQKSVDEAKRFGEIVNYNKDFGGFDDVNNKYLDLFAEIRKGSKTAEQAVEELNQAINNSESAQADGFNKQYSLSVQDSVQETEKQVEIHKENAEAIKEEAEAIEYLLDESGQLQKFYRGISAFNKNNEDSIDLYGKQFYSTNKKVAEAYANADGGEGVLLEHAFKRGNLLSIDNLGKEYNLISYLGDGIAEDSKKVINLFDRFSELKSILISDTSIPIVDYLNDPSLTAHIKNNTQLLEEFKNVLDQIKAINQDTSSLYGISIANMYNDSIEDNPLKNAYRLYPDSMLEKAKNNGYNQLLIKNVIDQWDENGNGIIGDTFAIISKDLIADINVAKSEIDKVKTNQSSVEIHKENTQAIEQEIQAEEKLVEVKKEEQALSSSDAVADIKAETDATEQLVEAQEKKAKAKKKSKTDDTSEEVKDIKDLDKAVDSVTKAVEKKTKAFETERDKVKGFIKDEIDLVKDLQKAVEGVTDSVQDKTDAFKDEKDELKDTNKNKSRGNKKGDNDNNSPNRKRLTNNGQQRDMVGYNTTRSTNGNSIDSYVYRDGVGTTVTNTLTEDAQGNLNEMQRIQVRYNEMVDSAVKASIEVRKKQSELREEMARPLPRQDIIDQIMIELNALADEYDRATDAAIRYIQEHQTYVNDTAEGSKFTAAQFFSDVDRGTAVKLAEENIKEITKEDANRSKQYYDSLNASVSRYIQLLKRLDTAEGSIRTTIEQMIQAEENQINMRLNATSTDPNLQRIRNLEEEAKIYRTLNNAREDSNFVRTQKDEIANINITIDLVKELTKQYVEARKAQLSGTTLTAAQENILNNSANIISPHRNFLQNVDQSVLSPETIKNINDALRAQEEQIDKINVAILQEYKNLPKLAKRLKELADTLTVNPNDQAASEEFNEIIAKLNRAINGAEEFKIELGGSVAIEQQLRDEAAKIANTDFFNGGVINSLLKQANALKDNVKTTEAYNTRVESLINSIKALQNLDVNSKDFNFKLQEAIKNLTQLKKDLKKPVSLSVSDENINKKILEINKNLHDNSAMNGQMKRRFKELRAEYQHMLNSDANKQEIDELNAKLEALKAELYDTGQVGKSAFMQFTDRIKSSSAQFLATYFSLQDWIRYIRTAFTTIQELDTALVDLKKTTAMSTQELEKFYYESNDVAKKMGVTTTEVINQASAWSRLGYNTREAATEMAQVSSLFASISPDMDTDMAQSGLVSLMKAFKVDVVNAEGEILDKVNIIGNNFAVTNGNIVSGLERSASSLYAANNSLEQSIALFTAGTEITQDAESMGAALRTMSMRIRGYDEDLEDYNMDVETLSGTIANLTKTAKTPGGISLFADKQKQTYKSTYQILKEISEIWNDITDKEQAQLLEKLFAKTRANQGAAILSNFAQAEAAMKKMTESAGSAEKEMENIRSSIDYKLNNLKQTWVGILQNLLKRNDLGELIDNASKASESFGNVVIKITPAINSLVKVLGSLLEVIGKIPPSFFEAMPSIMIGGKLTKSGIGVDLNKSSTIKSSLLGTSLSAGSQDFKAYSQYLIHTRNALNNVEGAADDAKVAFSKMSNTMQNSVKNANISQASLSTLNKEIKSVSSQTGVFAQTLKALGSTLLTGAIATAIMQLVSAIVSFNSEVQNMAQNAANAFKEETNQFSDYKKRIEDCYTVLNDSNATTEQSVQAHKDLFEIKRELIERYKDEAVNIDLVTNSIKGQTDALEQLEKVSAQAARNKFEAEFNENTTLEKWGSAALNMGKQALLTTYNPYFFFKGVFDSISKNGKDINAYWDDLTGTNFVDRYQMAIDKYTNFSKTISATTNDTLNEILDSYQSFDVNNGEINITGDVGQVQKDIADIQVSLSKYPGYTEEWSKELANVWEDAYKIDSQYGDAYRADIESRVLTDANANQLRQLVEDKYDAYVEAISGDDQNMIDNAIENFERAIQLVNEANLDPIIQKYIIELYPELTAVDTNDISSQLESSLEKYRNYDVNKYADVIDRANTFSSSYIPDLSEYGWGDGSLIGGAKARTYSNSEGTKAINFTPVITDEEGNVVGVLNSDELYNYAQDVINGVHDDFYNLSIGATFEGETALQDAVDYLQSSRMSFEDPLYKILNGGFNADSFAYDEEAIALLKEYVNQVQYGGDINELIETLVKYGYVARGSAETQQITNIADKLFANTSQGSDHTLYQTYWENIAQLTDEQRQKLINLKIPNDVFYSWEKLMDIINETNFNLDTKIKSTISDSVSQLNTEIKPQFDQLKSAYQAIFTEGYDELTGIGKGMDLSVVNVEMLEAIRKEFADIEEAYGKAFDDDKLNDFFRTLTNVESTAEDVQQAFNDLATEYFYSAEGMKNLNDETAAATEQMLEQMGVINADEVVDAMLQYNNLIGLYGELITAKQNLKSATGDEEVSIQNHIDAILNEITALGYEEEAMEAAKMAAFELALQEAGLSLNNIDTSADCQAILEIAESCGIAINAIEALRRVESAQKRYEDEGTMGAYYNLKYTKEAAVKEIEDISSSYKPIELAPIDIAWKPSNKSSGGGGGSKDASDAGKDEADAYVEAYTKELEQLDWLKQNGFITEKEYLDRFRDLYEKYFKDVTGYAKKFYEEQRKYLEGMKSLYQSAGNAAIYFLKKQIDGYNKEKDKALESLNAQKDAIDDQVKAKQKVIDGINDEIDAIQKANDARQKEIQLQKDLYALEKAQHQRPKLQYNEERGYHYESDITNIRDTKEQVEQDRLDIIIQKKQDQISLIEDEIDRLNAQTDAIDEQIAAMEDYYDKLIKGVEEYIQKWEDVLEEETIRQNLELLEELGISIDDLLNLDPNTLDNFRNGFFGVLDQLDAYKTYPEVLDEVAAAMDKVADAADKMNKAMSGGGGGGTKDKDKDKGTTQDTTSGIMVGAMKGAQVGSDTAQLSNSLLGMVTIANELATVMDNTTNTVSADTQQMANEVVEGTTKMVASMSDIGGAYTGVNTAMDTMSLQVATNIGDIATAFNGLSTSASDTQGILTGSIIPGIGGSIESLAETTNGKFAELQTTFTTFGDDVATTTSTIVDEQMPTLSESVNSTTEEASSGFDKVKASVENVISAVSSLISKMAELAKQKVSSIISGSSKLSGTAYAGGKYENGSNETALVGKIFADLKFI